MGTLAAAPSLLGVEEYIQGELCSEVRHEYIDGLVYAMAGAGKKHNRVAGNAFLHLRMASHGSGCGVFMSDMKLRVEAGNRFYYPDILVSCDPLDEEEYFIQRPCLVAEVLLPSAEATDRREKWLAYRDLPSLRYYLLIASQERRAEVYHRQADGGWVHQTLTEEVPLEIDCGALRLTLSLQDLYEDVPEGGLEPDGS